MPHVSFVTGEDGRAYMRNRYEALAPQPLFAGLEYSEDPAVLAEWVPLMMAGRGTKEPVAATRSLAGTDVNFGALTRLLLDDAVRRGVQLHLQHRVLKAAPRDRSGRWATTVRDLATGKRRTVAAASSSSAPAAAHCRCCRAPASPRSRASAASRSAASSCAPATRELVAQHQAKVYGQATVGAPPMSVPHLDLAPDRRRARRCCSAPTPASPPSSSRPARCGTCRARSAPATSARCSASAWTNIPLTKYLVGQVLQSTKTRLRDAAGVHADGARPATGSSSPPASASRSSSRTDTGRGVLQFGTELVVGGDGSIAGLLGASPGASTAVSAMLTLLERCFPAAMDGLAAAAAGGHPLLRPQAVRGARPARPGLRRHHQDPGAPQLGPRDRGSELGGHGRPGPLNRSVTGPPASPRQLASRPARLTARSRRSASGPRPAARTPAAPGRPRISRVVPVGHEGAAVADDEHHRGVLGQPQLGQVDAVQPGARRHGQLHQVRVELVQRRRLHVDVPRGHRRGDPQQPGHRTAATSPAPG